MLQPSLLLGRSTLTNQIYHIKDYKFSSTDDLLFDANAWLYIYGPHSDCFLAEKKTYTSAMSQIRSVKGRIFVDGFVMSEFINAYASFFYNKLPADAKPVNFKTFRNTQQFQSIAEVIAAKSSRVLQKCERIETGFTSVNLEQILRDYQQGYLDFNDRVLAELCQANDLKLVTHDRDFSGENLTIITGNPNLSS